MTPKIVFFLRLAGQTGRNRLQGALNFLKDNRRSWDLRLPQTEQQFAEELADGDVDGLIVATTNEKVIRRAERFAGPVVFVDIAKSMRTRFGATDVSIHNDDGGFGLMAARHFLSIGGFRGYGYVRALDNPPWDQQRERGFRTELRRRGHAVSVFAGKSHEALAAWLGELPQPAAVYVAWDERARDVVRACRASHLAIPKHITILGTDDDEIVCTLSSPELSSIHTDTVGAGYQAARWLDRLLRHAVRPGRHTVLCKALGITDRDSTKPPPPGQRLVEEALAYLKREHGPGVTPAGVARALRCSRRILDKRFADFSQETLGEALTRIRLADVRQRLKTTTRSIAEIGSACGFANANALKNLFKRTFGQSMRAYRAG